MRVQELKKFITMKVKKMMNKKVWEEPNYKVVRSKTIETSIELISRTNPEESVSILKMKGYYLIPFLYSLNKSLFEDIYIDGSRELRKLVTKLNSNSKTSNINLKYDEALYNIEDLVDNKTDNNSQLVEYLNCENFIAIFKLLLETNIPSTHLVRIRSRLITLDNTI